MGFFREIKKLKSYKFTIMIIPDTNKKVIQFNLSKLFLYSTFSIMIIISSYFLSKNIYLESLNSFLDSYNSELKNEIVFRNDKIEKLYSLRSEYESEMSYLKTSINSSALYFEEKLSELHSLESEVNSLLVMINDRGQTALSIPTSRSIDHSTLLAINDQNVVEPTVIDEAKDLTTDDEISSIIQEQMTNYKTLVEDVSSQLDFLECYPDFSPISGYITSNFGYRRDPFTGLTSFHRGVDITAPKNTEIHAAASGTVTYSGYNGNYGNMIVISHGYDYETVYAHNNKNVVKVGDQVTKGDLIGYIGSTGRSTGPHVHFEVHFEGKQINPRKTLTDY